VNKPDLREYASEGIENADPANWSEQSFENACAWPTADNASRIGSESIRRDLIIVASIRLIAFRMRYCRSLSSKKQWHDLSLRATGKDRNLLPASALT
jgi:hypothetical protein